MKKYIPYAVIAVLVILVLFLIPKGKTDIEKLYLDKAVNVTLKLEQTTIRDQAQAKIDAYNEKIQQIDSKLFDAINGTTTAVATGTGLTQASQPQVVVQ